MKIERLSAINFKNLQLKDVPFRSVTLVLGENGVGKSNLLLLIHTLFMRKKSPTELAQQQFAIEGFVEDEDLLRRGENQGSATVTLTCFSRAFEAMRDACGGKSDNVTVEFSLRRYSNGMDVRVARIALGRNAIYPVPGKDDDKSRAAKRKALEDWVNADLGNATTYIPNARLQKRGLADFKVRQPANAAQDLENTLLRLLTDRDVDPDILDRIKATLERFFGVKDLRSELSSRSVLSPLGPPPTDAPRESLLGVGIRLKEKSGEWFDLARVGTGIQQILVIVTMIQESPARIALIEEFESSLSIKKRNQFLQQLIELVGPGKPLRQVIVTSHAVFQPRADAVHSIGTDHPTARDKVNFRAWSKYDWMKHIK